jgi:hypothetical protein
VQQLFALSLGIAAMVFAATQSNAQSASSTPQCAPRKQVMQVLATRYGETHRSIGLAAGNQVMEIYASDAGSLTFTFTRADGLMYLFTSGQNFDAASEPLALNDPPA